MLLVLLLLFAQAVNPASSKWVPARDGSESVVLREDERATEYLVRVPPGHVFRPHWHSVDERLVLLEGRLSLRQADGPETFLDAGGYAFLPAKQAQHTRCVSAARCAFYVFWDGKLDFHPVD